MASQSFPTKFTSAAGTGSSANLLAAVAGNSFKVWQLAVANSGAAAAVTIVFTLDGTSQTLTVEAPASSTAVLPFSGAPWAAADVGTGVTFTAANTVTLGCYYTQAG